MTAISYKEIVAGMAAFGFIAGWITGAFMALWCYVSLGL